MCLNQSMTSQLSKINNNIVDPQRSLLMSRIGPKDTKPELTVRKLVHGLGYRYRLHRRELPGTPDICFPGRQKVIFVHGCFWHRHDRCRKTTTPKTRTAFWEEKFRQNVARDQRNLAALKELGWHTLTVWECECKQTESLANKLMTFLE